MSAVGRGNVLGVQFHPERSGDDGLQLLANAVELARSGRWPAPGPTPTPPLAAAAVR